MQMRRQILSCTAIRVGLLASALVAASLGSSVSAADEKWPAEMFEKQSHDFGVVARGSDVNYRLKLKNIFKETVHITEVRTTCGCSAGEPSQETLASLEEAYVTITMDTRKFTRRKDSNVIVVLDRPVYGRVQIPITAYIRTDVVIEPGSVQFDNVDREQKNERTLKISYAGRADWTIRDVKTQSEFVMAEVKQTARGAGRANYDLIVRLSDKTPIGPLRQFLTLVTDDPENTHVPLLVEGFVRPDIVVKPSLISLGTMRPGQTKTVNVVLQGKKPFEVSGVTCLRAKDVFQVRLPKRSAPVQIIPLTITAPQKLGPLDEELSVTIRGRTEPVTFRARGKVAASGK